jgi:hypothetical protein
LLYHFYPNGSRYLKDCQHLCVDNWTQGPNKVEIADRFDQTLSTEHQTVDSFAMIQPVLFCHDQEPLLFDYYNDDAEHMKEFFNSTAIVRPVSPELKNFNLRWVHPLSLQKTWILLHSELNSDELTRYESSGSFIGAYWWSHAMLALDWYRFAEHDPALHITNSYQKLFLIYCRDTTGSRTYRKTFMSGIKEKNIIEDCQVGSFLNYSVTSDSSAIYDSVDHNQTAISVVLETVFDNRIHLTEKSLRPLACGHPFMLAAGPGSLALLKKYGFRTFSPYIDETYDTVQDCDLRLDHILSEMKRIQQLPDYEKSELINQCNLIAEFNKKHFFSTDFFNLIVKELQDNVNAAFEQHQGQTDFSVWWTNRKWRKKNLLLSPKDSIVGKLVNYLIKSCRLSRQSKAT